MIKSRSLKYHKCKYFTYCSGSLLMLTLTVMFIRLVFPYPFHASCILKWKFGEPCTYVMQSLRWQILNWSSYHDCGTRGSKCLYTLLNATTGEENVIRAKHKTPDWKMTEDIKISFENAKHNICIATGESVTNNWFITFDYGKNYCNLHNLVLAVGLDRHPKFMELTGNSVCTQYTMARCDVQNYY